MQEKDTCPKTLVFKKKNRYLCHVVDRSIITLGPSPIMKVTTPVGFDTRAEEEVERMPPGGTRNERRFQKLVNMDAKEVLTSIKVDLPTKVNK